MSDGGARRIVLSTTAETFGKLDVMAAGPRFSGNRSKAVTWAIELAAAILADAAVKDRLFESPDEALSAFVAAHRGRK